MKGKRRRHDPEFKARVALEAIKGIKTIQEIAKEYDIHPVQVSDWKKTMAQNAASAFGAGAGKTDAGEFERELHDSGHLPDTVPGLPQLPEDVPVMIGELLVFGGHCA
jgi:transposase/putative transposase